MRSRTDVETRVIKAFKDQGYSLTMAVVPCVVVRDPQDPRPQSPDCLRGEKLSILNRSIEDGSVDPALHGYSHKGVTRIGSYSEFAGKSYEEQRTLLLSGRSTLEAATERRISTFVPPYNTYDRTTLRALDDLRFDAISANLSGPADEGFPLKFLPATADLKSVRQGIDAARRMRHLRAIIVVMLHEFDFTEVNSQTGMCSLKEFEDLLRWLKQQEDVQVLSVRQTLETTHDLSVKRYISNKKRLIERFRPPFLPGLYVHLVYLPIGIEPSIRTRGWLMMIVFYPVLFLGSSIAYGACLLGLRIAPQALRPIGMFLSVLALPLIVVYFVRDFNQQGFMAAVGLTVFTGSLLGIYVATSIKSWRTQHSTYRHRTQ
jgi:peptidoglycan/xylan/chitin deacetylase (PgdA/CDA1 family)